MALNSGMLMCR